MKQLAAQTCLGCVGLILGTAVWAFLARYFYHGVAHIPEGFVDFGVVLIIMFASGGVWIAAALTDTK